MKLLVTFITDLIFPPSSDALRIRTLTPERFTALHFHPVPIEHGVALSTFAHEHVTACVHLAKFNHHTHAFALLSALLKEYLHTLPTEEMTIIPMPLSRQRMHTRGYNQVKEVVDRACPPLLRSQIRTDLLHKRTKVSQTSLKRAERIENQKGAFFTRTPFPTELTQRHIILIDDVYTTGATMQSAYQTLVEAGCTNVTCVALSH